MCQRIKCRTCGKFTYSGCGMHVDQVLAGVPQSERCGGHSSADQPTKSRWFLFRRR